MTLLESIDERYIKAINKQHDLQDLLTLKWNGTKEAPGPSPHKDGKNKPITKHRPVQGTVCVPEVQGTIYVPEVQSTIFVFLG